MSRAEEEPFWPGWRELCRFLLSILYLIGTFWLIWEVLTPALVDRGVTGSAVMACRFGATAVAILLGCRLFDALFGSIPVNAKWGLGGQAVRYRTRGAASALTARPIYARSLP